MMSNKQIVDYLMQYRQYRLYVRRLEVQIDQYADSVGCTHLSEMPKAEHSGNGAENKFVRYADLTSQLNDANRRLLEIRDRIEWVLNSLEQQYYDVLHFYYIDCLTWEKTADRLGFADIRYVYRLRNRAIRKLKENAIFL